MPAYIFANVEVTDPQAYQEYSKNVSASITAYGGRFLVRGASAESLEGDMKTNRLVILEFPDMARLKLWYDSPEYEPLLALRKRAATSQLIAIEGV